MKAPGASAKGSDLRRKKGGHLFSQDKKEPSVFAMGGDSVEQRAGTRGCKRLGSVCLMVFPRCLQSKGCLLSFLRGKVARLEREVSKPFLNPRGLCCHLSLYLLGLQQREGLPVSRVRKQHENWPCPHNSREHGWTAWVLGRRDIFSRNRVLNETFPYLGCWEAR